MPPSIALTFLAKLDPASTKVTVTGPNGAATAGRPAVTGNKVTVGLRDGGGGVYTVAYRVISVDGHPVKGELTFTVTAPAKPSPVPSASGPAVASPAPGPAGTTPTSASFVAVSDGAGEATPWSPWLPWALGGGVLAAAAGVATWLIRRRSAG